MSRRIIEEIWATNANRIIQPSPSRSQQGWEGFPAVPDAKIENWEKNLYSELLDHISKNGIPIWIATETYPINGLCQHNGITYKSLQASNLNKEPIVEPTYWSTSNFSNKYDMEGLVPSNNATNPDYQIDLTAGKCRAENGSSIIEFTSSQVVDYETLNGGALGTDTTYHLFGYLKDDKTSQLYLATTLTPTIPNIDSALAYRRITSDLTDGSDDLIANDGVKLPGGAIEKRLRTNIQDEINLAVNTSTFVYASYSIPTGLKFLVNMTLTAIISSAIRQIYAEDSISGQTIKVLEGDSQRALEVLNLYSKTDATIGFKSGTGGEGLNIWLNGYTDFRNYF